MKAIEVENDEDNSLVWADVPTPEPDAGEVLVRVAATAVNRADLLQRRGMYPPPDGASDILGLEVAGRVAESGSDVDEWDEGDRVCALVPGGGYAEYVTVPAGMLLSVPDNLDLEEAAGIPEVFYTAFLNLRLEAEQSPGDRVLVHAGASGVGTAAIQLCDLFDSPVYATASRGKLDFLRELGVEVAVDRKNEDFADLLTDELDGEGIDIVLDPVAGDYLPRNIQLLGHRGRLVIIGLLGGTDGSLPMGQVLTKRLRIIGSVLRSRALDAKLQITDEFRREVWPHFESGRLRPIIHETFPIEEAEQAHALIRSNSTIGKVLLLFDH
jgi:putative PIG3 family NAD(P)H quinone oxidoreductase